VQVTGTGGEISGGGVRYYAEPRTHKRHTLDFYTEPRWTVDLLLAAEAIRGPVLDPACGAGTIVKACLAHGIVAAGSDIAERPFGECGIDFLGISAKPPATTIICNPPYALAEQFARRALEVATDKVALLLQSKFPYSQRRYDFFAEHPPARIYFLSTRPSMPPGDKLIAGTVEAKGGKLDYLWMVWDRRHPRTPTTVGWLRK
jgi:hypothetical protein